MALSEPPDFRHKHAQRKAQRELEVTGEVVVVDKRPEGGPAPRFKEPVDLSVGPHVLDKPKDGHGGPEHNKHYIEDPGAAAVTEGLQDQEEKQSVACDLEDLSLRLEGSQTDWEPGSCLVSVSCYRVPCELLEIQTFP